MKNLVNSLSILSFSRWQDTTIEKFTIRKVCSTEKTTNTTVKLFVWISETSKGQNFQSYKGPFQENKDCLNQMRGPLRSRKGTIPQSSQQETMVEKGLSSKDLYMWVLCNGVTPSEIHRTTKLRKLCGQKYWQFGLKGTRYKMKRDCQTLKTLLTGSRQDKFTQLPIHTSFH